MYVYYRFALYFILSRDVPILKSFSAGRPKIFACCSGGCSVVAAVAELSWPIVGCKNGRRKQRIAPPNFSFLQYQRQNKNYQSDYSAKHTVSSKVTQRFFASDEVVTWKAWELARICFHSSLSGSDRALSLLDSFSSSYLFECPSRVFVWMLESINIVEQIDEDNYLLTVEICRGS